MPQHDKRTTYLPAWGVIFFSAVALSTVVEVIGAPSLAAALSGLEHQLERHAKDASLIETNGSPARTVINQPDTMNKTDLMQTVQFMPRPGEPPMPPQGPMGMSRFPLPGRGFPDAMPPGMSPRAMCLDDISRHMAMYGYMKSRLLLTDSQKSTARAIDEAMESSTAKIQALCQTLPTEAAAPPGLMEAADFMERDLAARLDMLRAVKGPMHDLFEQLSPDQRAVLDHPPLPPFPPR